MSSYLTIYVKINDEEPIALMSWSRSSQMYAYFNSYVDNELSIIREECIKEVITEVQVNLHSIKEQNDLLLKLGNNGLNPEEYISPIDLIMENEDKLKEGREFLGQLKLLLDMIDAAKYTNDYKLAYLWGID